MSNNRRIVFASILAAILTTGLLALNPSAIGNVQAQMYEDRYGYDNNYYQDDNNRYDYAKDSKKSSHADIQKIKCVNSNININGIDVKEVPQDTAAVVVTNEESTENSNGLADRINFDRNLVNICVNVNENEQKVTPPETTLSVKKTITCELPNNPDPEEVEACQRITTEILPEYFTIFVSGNNANPDTFTGSMVPEIVTLDPGNYVVSETRDESKVDGTRADIERDLGVLLDGPAPNYSGDCKTNVFAGEGEGTIAAGESQVCNIENLFRFT